jgi:hypothetical protein
VTLCDDEHIFLGVVLIANEVGLSENRAESGGTLQVQKRDDDIGWNATIVVPSYQRIL